MLVHPNALPNHFPILLSAVKQVFKNTMTLFIHTYSGKNQMWILKNSKDLLNYLSSSSTYMTEVTQNNTGMYTEGTSQQTFEIPNNIWM